MLSGTLNPAHSTQLNVEPVVGRCFVADHVVDCAECAVRRASSRTHRTPRAASTGCCVTDRDIARTWSSPTPATPVDRRHPLHRILRESDLLVTGQQVPAVLIKKGKNRPKQQINKQRLKMC